MSPQRIQRKRTKGWRMPPNTVSVCRPGKWGNPYKVGTCLIPNAQAAVDAFSANLPLTIDLSELRGKNLACWCKLGDPCHADVLLEIANAALPLTQEQQAISGAGAVSAPSPQLRE